MCVGDRLHDRKTEADPVGGGACVSVEPLERLEEAGEFATWDHGTRVHDREVGTSCAAVSGDADRETARLVVESADAVLSQAAVAQLAEPLTRRARERTGSQNGHGIGLSIVAALAAAHNGRLRLYAREQGGLGAEITLPVAPEPQSAIGPA